VHPCLEHRKTEKKGEEDDERGREHAVMNSIPLHSSRESRGDHKGMADRYSSSAIGKSFAQSRGEAKKVCCKVKS
jgi:hypothetical protein